MNRRERIKAEFGGELPDFSAALDASDYFATGVRGQETVRLNLEFPGIVCTKEEDMARQEYALSTDIGYQISKFGVGHPVTFGEQDFDRMDLTTSMQIIEESSQRWLSLPKVIRDRYHSWGAVERAAKSGELDQLLRTAGAPAGSSGGATPSAGGSGGTTPGVSSVSAGVPGSG